MERNQNIKKATQSQGQETGPRIVTEETREHWKNKNEVSFFIPAPTNHSELTEKDVKDFHIGHIELDDVLYQYKKADSGLWDGLQIQLLNIMSIKKLTDFRATQTTDGMLWINMKFDEEWTAEEKGEEA